LTRLSGVWLGLFAATCAVAACTGDPADGTGGTPEPPVCTDDSGLLPGPSPVRRMTRFEYNNTVRDLLGDTTEPAKDFPVEEESNGFSNNANDLVVTPVLAEKYMLAAESVAGRAVADAEGLTGCFPGADAKVTDGCMREFIAAFGKRAYRRPLSADEVEQLLGIFHDGVAIESTRGVPAEQLLRAGVSLVLENMLQSPDFLYRVELGEGMSPVDPAATIVPVSSFEMASRLSYFLWGSMPDDELFAAAESDGLRTKEQVAAQARRMLDDPRARDAVSMFHQQWLDYDRISNVGKNPSMFPEWSPAIGSLMKEEMRSFIEHVVFDGEGDMKTLLTASYSYADRDLAKFYGVSGGGEGEATRVDFDPQKHAGILSMGAILAYYAHSDQTSPVLRGKLVREVFLCDTLDPPPAMFQPPMPDPNTTGRERAKEHASGGCADCHKLMDPIGFGFENFDALGRWRDEENAAPIDASGSIIESDVDGNFDGVRQLADKLADSDDVRGCYAKMWFRYAYGRMETTEDACTLDQVTTSFGESGGSVKELLVALTQTDAFMYRRAGSTQAGGGQP
jgi:hypothetical protein